MQVRAHYIFKWNTFATVLGCFLLAYLIVDAKRISFMYIMYTYTDNSNKYLGII